MVRKTLANLTLADVTRHSGVLRVQVETLRRALHRCCLQSRKIREDARRTTDAARAVRRHRP